MGRIRDSWLANLTSRSIVRVVTTAPLSVVLLAAGGGTRFGGDKLLASVGGRPVIDLCLDALEGSSLVARVVVVAPVPSPVADHATQARTVPVTVVPGGATRHLSEQAGLAAVLAAGPTELLAFHDAARPFLTPGLIASLVAAVADADGAVPVVSAGETLFRREGDRAHRLAPEPVRVQTPQVFRTDVVVEAFARSGGEHDADTSETVARTGARIAVVPGDEHNLKITHPIDLARSRAIAERRP